MQFFVSILIVFSVGCVRHSNYKLARLVSPMVREERIVVEGKSLELEELKILFGNTCSIKKITAVQLHLNNATPNSYIFTPRAMNVKAIPLNLVARSLHKNIFVRLIPLGLLSLFCWPFSVPTTILSMRAMHYNEMVDRQLYEMGIDPFDSFIIEPYSTLNRVIFIKNKHMPDLLSLQLEQINNDNISIMHEFSVSLVESV